jgi:hypothetical protein
MKTTKTTFGKHDVGCVLDCSYRSADTLNHRTVELAIEFGMVADDDTKKLLARLDYDVAKEDDSQLLSDCGDEAVDYLNSLDLPSYCSFYFDDNSLFLAPCIENVKEDVGFVSGQSEDANPDDSDRPCDDYQGEWLHVSDHGNCTLYVRGDDGKDTEIWSVV